MHGGLGMRYFGPGADTGGFLVVGGAAEEEGGWISSSSSAVTLKVRAFLINSGSTSCDSANDRLLSSSIGLCCGVFRNWFAQGTMCFSSAVSSFFFSKSSKFLGRDLAFSRISFMLMPPEAEDLGGGGAFFLGSFPFFVWAGSVLVLPEVS